MWWNEICKEVIEFPPGYCKLHSYETKELREYVGLTISFVLQLWDFAIGRACCMCLEWASHPVIPVIHDVQLHSELQDLLWVFLYDSYTFCVWRTSWISKSTTLRNPKAQRKLDFLCKRENEDCSVPLYLFHTGDCTKKVMPYDCFTTLNLLFAWKTNFARNFIWKVHLWLLLGILIFLCINWKLPHGILCVDVFGVFIADALCLSCMKSGKFLLYIFWILFVKILEILIVLWAWNKFRKNPLFSFILLLSF